MLESRWILISCKERQNDKFLYNRDFSSATWEGCFYGLRAEPQPFEPDKLFNPFRPDIAKLQYFPVWGTAFLEYPTRKG